MANQIELRNWYAQPIHCPFCGTALPPDEGVSCKHLLYVVSAGDFCSRTARFDQALGETEGWPEFYKADIERYGPPLEVARRILNELPNGVEFEVYGPTDSTFIGFAVFEDELCGWGRDHKSPYDE